MKGQNDNSSISNNNNDATNENTAGTPQENLNYHPSLIDQLALGDKNTYINSTTHKVNLTKELLSPSKKIPVDAIIRASGLTTEDIDALIGRRNEEKNRKEENLRKCDEREESLKKELEDLEKRRKKIKSELEPILEDIKELTTFNSKIANLSSSTTRTEQTDLQSFRTDIEKINNTQIGYKFAGLMHYISSENEKLSAKEEDRQNDLKKKRLAYEQAETERKERKRLLKEGNLENIPDQAPQLTVSVKGIKAALSTVKLSRRDIITAIENEPNLATRKRWLDTASTMIFPNFKDDDIAEKTKKLVKKFDLIIAATTSKNTINKNLLEKNNDTEARLKKLPFSLNLNTKAYQEEIKLELAALQDAEIKSIVITRATEDAADGIKQKGNNALSFSDIELLKDNLKAKTKEIEDKYASYTKLLGQLSSYDSMPFYKFKGDLSGFDFSGLDLTNARFEDCILIGCKFNNAITDGAVFTNSILINTDFEGATVVGANFDNAEITGSNLSMEQLLTAESAKTRVIDLKIEREVEDSKSADTTQISTNNTTSGKNTSHSSSTLSPEKSKKSRGKLPDFTKGDNQTDNNESKRKSGSHKSPLTSSSGSGSKSKLKDKSPRKPENPQRPTQAAPLEHVSRTKTSSESSVEKPQVPDRTYDKTNTNDKPITNSASSESIEAANIITLPAEKPQPAFLGKILTGGQNGGAESAITNIIEDGANKISPENFANTGAPKRELPTTPTQRPKIPLNRTHNSTNLARVVENDEKTVDSNIRS
jgi:uncharacterized protein YjbI with pentapeptide repeats